MGNWLKKDFLLGIGFGCIISAFLVSIFGVGTMSDEEVVARASKLGMVKQEMPWNGKPESTESPGETPPGETPSGETSSANAGKATQPAGTGQPATAETSEKSGQSQAASESQTTNKSNTTSLPQAASQSPVVPTETKDAGGAAKNSAETAVVTITDRMGSESVARMLEKKGVIKDQYEFLKVVDSHNAARRFQTGNFKVPVNGDLEDILYILIGKKR